MLLLLYLFENKEVICILGFQFMESKLLDS